MIVIFETACPNVAANSYLLSFWHIFLKIFAIIFDAYRKGVNNSTGIRTPSEYVPYSVVINKIKHIGTGTRE